MEQESNLFEIAKIFLEVNCLDHTIRYLQPLYQAWKDSDRQWTNRLIANLKEELQRIN